MLRTSARGVIAPWFIYPTWPQHCVGAFHTLLWPSGHIKGLTKSVIKTKYNEYCEKLKSILDCYKSVKQLNEQSNAYQITKKRKYHEAYNDCQRYNRTMKKIRLYEGEHNIKGLQKFNAQLNEDNVSPGIGSRVVDISVSEVYVNGDEEEVKCLNCHRKQHQFLIGKCDSGSNELPYVITFCQHYLQEIRRKRKFKNIDVSVFEELDKPIS